MLRRKPEAASALRRLGAAVARTRILKDTTQESVAEAAGISVQFLRRVERGTGNPSYLTMLAVAKALDIELTDLMGAAR
jgi:transcriptional regulator with XRE-family HTH domain